MARWQWYFGKAKKSMKMYIIAIILNVDFFLIWDQATDALNSHAL